MLNKSGAHIHIQYTQMCNGGRQADAAQGQQSHHNPFESKALPPIPSDASTYSNQVPFSLSLFAFINI